MQTLKSRVITGIEFNNVRQEFLSEDGPRIIPVDPPIVNINKNNNEKKTELILRCNNGGFPRYVVNQLNIFVPVGKDIKIVTPVK